MKREYIVQMRPHFGNEERQALFQYDFENNFITEFKYTHQFERDLSDRLGVERVCLVNNGTIAISIAALALGIGPGDEVIVPNFTMIATPNAVKLLGAIPVFADVEPDTWCISKEEIFEKITPKTKAVIIVNANGRSPSYDIQALTVELNALGISVIEDAAQSLGSKYPDGTPIGTKSNIATLSFSGPKIISTGQGGAVYSKNNELMHKVKVIKDFGRQSGGNDEHSVFGLNSKFTDLQAIVGIEQLKQLDQRITRRIQQNILYDTLLAGCDHVECPKQNYAYTVPWFTEVLVDDPDNLASYLHDNQIGSRRVYPEVNKQKVYGQTTTLYKSANISRRGLWLPSHMGVTDDIINEICTLIINYYN